jgi:hypothetical protein
VTEGALVWFELRRGDWRPGIVLRYRPEVHGGSWSQSYMLDGVRQSEWMSEPIRGECLVQLLDGEGIGWVDEKRLRTPEEHETASAQGAS